MIGVVMMGVMAVVIDVVMVVMVVMIDHRYEVEHS
jgi:hypothetical protein